MRDDSPLFSITKDISGGMNNRIEAGNLSDKEVSVLYNADISTPGQVKKSPGITLLENLGASVGVGLFGFEPSNGTPELMAAFNQTLAGWVGTGSFVNRKTDFTAGSPVRMLTVGQSGSDDVLAIYIPNNNWFIMNQGHSFSDLGNTNTSPPLSPASAYFRARLWILKENGAYYSDPFPSDYSTAFDRITDYYYVPVGDEKAIVAIRDQGLVFFGSNAVYGLNPSVTPAATDKTEKIIDIGTVAGGTCVLVGDDILFLATDGVRGLFRTQLDKVQAGASYPLSYALKDELANVSWQYVSKATAVYFDNKYFLSLPVNASSYNNQVWIFYPATNGWVVRTGWNVAAWAKIKINGKEKLYAIDSTSGKVYEAWSGYDDNGTAINYQEEGRKDYLGKPLTKKAGGELKIRAKSSGNYDLSIFASVDDQDYTLLGTMNLSDNSPTLPTNLPIQLEPTNLIEETFHLDSLGEFYSIKPKIQHNDLSGSDEITILDRMIVSYPCEYQSE